MLTFSFFVFLTNIQYLFWDSFPANFDCMENQTQNFLRYDPIETMYIVTLMYGDLEARACTLISCRSNDNQPNHRHLCLWPNESYMYILLIINIHQELNFTIKVNINYVIFYYHVPGTCTNYLSVHLINFKLEYLKHN